MSKNEKRTDNDMRRFVAVKQFINGNCAGCPLPPKDATLTEVFRACCIAQDLGVCAMSEQGREPRRDTLDSLHPGATEPMDPYHWHLPDECPRREIIERGRHKQ